MALVVSTLASELTAAMSTPYPETQQEAAERFAAACATYFGATTFPPPSPVIGAAEQAFIPAFLGGLNTTVPLRFTALELGLVAMVAVIATGAALSPPDSATPPVGQPIISLSQIAPSAVAAAQAISVIVDVWARTGTYTKPPASPVPWA